MRREQLLTETVNQVSDNDLVALANVARDLLAGEFVGTPLKFAKGDWSKVVIEDGEKVEVEIGATETFIVDPLSHASGWVKWLDGKPAGRIGPGRLVDGFILPARNRLGDLEESDWPIRGKQHEDPWQEAHQLTVKDTADGNLLTWVTPSWGGRKAIGNFLKAYLAEAKHHPGLYPVAMLASREEMSADYGKVQKPVLKIVDWAAFGDGAAPAGSPSLAPTVLLPAPPDFAAKGKKAVTVGDEMDDEIPFK